MGNLFAGPHLWIILIIILLLFGAAKLPALAKSLGQSARVFKGEMKAMKEDDAPGTPADGSAPTQTGTAASSAPERPADQDTPPRAS
ncbi:twin-arginine translocase TatA/TatE family subunit [Microbacterium sp.]|uniref:twin-arginine translocase TatA/TatE family subunit n=1 Tax=Microbacterium sp. TaxID=51671 RepID=UPI003C755EFA